jgi:xylulokinase
MSQKADVSRCVLAIDLGSGGPKAGLVSETGDILATAAATVDTLFLPGGGAEQDPGQWWDRAKHVVHRVMCASGVAKECIMAVACTSQWSVIVPVDPRGNPLMNAIHWMDTRGGKHNRALTRGFPSVQGYDLVKLFKWLRLTGLAPTHSGADSLGHIQFIKHELPEIYHRTYKFLEPMDYLTMRLTGRMTATQHTAAPLMLVDNRTWSRCAYDDGLLALAGLEREKLPDLIPSNAVVGPLLPSVAEELGLLPATPVLAGINDTNASAIGCGAAAPFEGIIYIGTSLVMTCHLPFKKTDMLHMLTAMPSPLPAKYLLMAEQGTGGKSLDFFLHQIVFGDDALATTPIPADVYKRVNRAAASEPAGSHGVLFLPWLNGTLTPEENPAARGGFFNLSLQSTRSHMVRAVMEGLAFNSRWTLEPVQKFIGRTFPHFRFAGGGALSDTWAQIHADILGMPILQMADPTHVTLRGAAFFALEALGGASLASLAQKVKTNRVFEPQPAHREIYDRMYAQFRAFFKRNKKIFAALNRP